MKKTTFTLFIIMCWISPHLIAETTQETQGNCSPAIVHITGNVSIVCSDPKAVDALLSLVKQMKSLALSDSEKTEIIGSQQATIARLVEEKNKSQRPGQYDRAFDALGKGDPSLADKLLDSVLIDFEKEAIKAAQLYREKGALWYARDTRKALDAYKRAIQLNPNSKKGWNQLGSLYQRIGELDKAETALLTLLNLADGDPPNQAAAYGNLGVVYRARGESDKAVEYFEKALVISKALGDKEGIASTYGNLGLVYLTLGELDKAAEYQENSLTVFRALGRKKLVATSYGNLGIMYSARGELDKAVEYYEKALAIDKALGSKEGIAIHYSNLGNVHLARGELDKTVEYCEKALAINKALDNKEIIANNYSKLGGVYQIRGELDKAAEYHEKALAINKASGRKEGMAINYHNLGIVYRARGELDKAAEYHEKALTLFKAVGAVPQIEKAEFIFNAAAANRDQGSNTNNSIPVSGLSQTVFCLFKNRYFCRLKIYRFCCLRQKQNTSVRSLL